MLKINSYSLAFVVFIALSMAAFQPAGAQEEYSITDLGVLTGDGASHAYDINNSGQVVGDTIQQSGNVYRAFLKTCVHKALYNT